MSTQKTVVSFRREGGETITLGNGELGKPYLLLSGSLGLGVAPTSFSATPVPGGDGSLLRGKRLGEREPFVPVMLEAGSPAELDSLRDGLTRVLSPSDSRPLFLRVETPGRNGYRELEVHYAGGLQGDYGGSYAGSWETLGLEFRAFDAYWQGSPVSISQSVDPARKNFLSSDPASSFFPVILADSTVDAQIVLQIAGDSPTWPVWQITPPGEDLLIVHTTTGKRFYLDGLLSTAVTIDMEEGTIVDANGVDLWDRVSEDSEPFTLQPGRNVLEFSMVGSTADSMVHVTYRPRYLAGH